MVPLDGSGNAELAIDQALPIAERLGAQISVMYSVPWLEASYSAAPELIAVDNVRAAKDARLEADMAAYVQDVIARFRDKLRLQTVAMRGHPATAIITAAENHEIDLIVMTTQGAGGIVHRGLGSVVDAVAKNSGIPVMLVRPSGG
jgi:nucleotide-binding universal stress UspA family protein